MKGSGLLEPGWTGHDGPDWIRVQAPSSAAKKVTNASPSCLERDEYIRMAHAEGATLHNLCLEFSLQYSTICKIIGATT